MSQSKMYLWSEIKPETLANIRDRYVIIYDQTLGGFKFDNLPKAINMMAERGWRCINITIAQAIGGLHGLYMYALMERA